MARFCPDQLNLLVDCPRSWWPAAAPPIEHVACPNQLHFLSTHCAQTGSTSWQHVVVDKLLEHTLSLPTWLLALHTKSDWSHKHDLSTRSDVWTSLHKDKAAPPCAFFQSGDWDIWKLFHEDKAAPPWAFSSKVEAERQEIKNKTLKVEERCKCLRLPKP